jgi:hypothetical protein
MEDEAQLKIKIERETRRQLNIKTAEDGLTTSAVIRAAIADYLAGKWRPKPDAKGARA